MQGLDAILRPGRQAASNVVADRIRHGKQRETPTKDIGKTPPGGPLVVSKCVVHTDHRESRSQAGDVDRLGAVGNDQGNVATDKQTAQCMDRTQLQPGDLPGRIPQERNFVRFRSEYDILGRRTGEVYRQNLVGRTAKECGVLPRHVGKGARIAVAELENPASAHDHRWPEVPPA